MPESISGTFSALFLYNVCEQIRLDDLRAILKVAPPGREPPFRRPAPDYVHFAQPPLIEVIAPVALVSGEHARGRIVYFDYGVMSLTLVLPFTGTWEEIVGLSARWMNSPELEQKASEVITVHIATAQPALVDQFEETLAEDYYVTWLTPMVHPGQPPVTAAALIENHGHFIAQIVRGEPAAFSAAELHEILDAKMSYYETDLLVVGWSAALLYDTPEGAAPTLQLLEYANSQLLEFRHYDGVLTRLLSEVYRKLEHRSGFFSRWRLAREAERLNLIRLEIRELTEKVDNSIKFLSDMFAARLYRMAAARIGVPDYRMLVEQKLQSAGELYGFLMDRFYHGRAFVLEAMIVFILIIDLVFLFRGI